MRERRRHTYKCINVGDIVLVQVLLLNETIGNYEKLPNLSRVAMKKLELQQ